MDFVKDENHKYEGVYPDDTMKKNAFVVFFLRFTKIMSPKIFIHH